MKKVLFGLFALSCITMAAETNLYLRTGVDLNGKFDVISIEGEDFSEKKADDFAWEIAVEATREFYPNLEIGFGLAYQDHGNPKKYTEIEDNSTTADYDIDEYKMSGYTSIPLYLTAKYNFKTINNFIPYIKANIGYSFNNDNGDLKFHSEQYNSSTNLPTTDPNYPIDDTAKVKIENGLYCGIGAGFEYNNFTLDLMYQLNQAKSEISFFDEDDARTYKVKDDFNYSRVTLSFGYKFNLEF